MAKRHSHPTRPRTLAHLKSWGVLALAFFVPLLVWGIAQETFPKQIREPAWGIVLIAVSQLSLLAVLSSMRRLGTASTSPTTRLEATASGFPRIRSVRRLLRLMSHTLVRCLGASHATIYLEEPHSRTYWLAVGAGSDPPVAIQQLDAESPLIQWLLEHRRPLSPQDCPSSLGHNGSVAKTGPYRRLRFVLDNLSAQLVVPSLRGKRLVGVLVLGARANRRAYTEDEVTTVRRLARDCAVALDNARSFEQLRAASQKLESAQERLLRQERMVAAGRLAMGLAHEIKNPLAAIKTFTEFLLERYDDPSFRQEFSMIVGKEVDRINRIVQSLSDFAKPVLLRVETTDVQQVVRETVALLSNECLKHDVAPVEDLEPQPILLPADPSQLKQAFLNLCMNALEAMPKGGTLSVRCRYDAGEAAIQIADTGVGIAPEHVAHLFDPFFTTKQSGMGLGLSVVKQIIDQHAGTIRVESRVGEGAVFVIRLPLAVRLTPRQAEAVGPSTERQGAPHRLGLDLLVVDDEPRIGETIKACCEAWGCQVRVVETGEEALRAISQWPPQLLLLDLALEELNGFEVLRRVKLAYPHMLIVVITGTEDPAVDREVQALGAMACLHKPIDMTTLREHLTRVSASLPSTPAGSSASAPRGPAACG